MGTGRGTFVDGFLQLQDETWVELGHDLRGRGLLGGRNERLGGRKERLRGERLGGRKERLGRGRNRVKSF